MSQMTLQKIFLTLCISCTPFLGFAQKPYPKEHSFGITGGVNLSRMSFTPTVLQDYKMGQTMGITWRYVEEKYFGIQAELLYTSKGWKERFDDNPALYYERTLNYIELPVLSHIFFGNHRIKGFVNLGPKFGYYLSDSQKSNIPKGSDEDIPAHNLAVSSKVDYGITGGAGMELRFGKHSFLVEGRYYFGLGDIFPNKKKDDYDASANQTISVAATYLFHLTKKR
ncbi:MAG: porin family protein [Bacteroidales bacterium]